MTLEEVKKARLAGVEADLKKYGIENAKEVVYNPTYEELFKEETLPSLEGYEKGVGAAEAPQRTGSVACLFTAGGL